MILDLSQYVNTIGTYSELEAAKAIEEKFRPLDAGVHECTLVDFKKTMPYNAPAGTEPQICVVAKDPNWLMFTPIFENVNAQRTSICVIMPLTNSLQYVGKDGPTTYPYKGFMDFVAAIGFDPLEDDRPETLLMRAITSTNAEILTALIGAQVKVKVEWGTGRFLHPFYDAETKVYYLVNSEGGVPEEVNEPFSLNKEIKTDEKWMEMATKAKDAGYIFQRQPLIKLLRHDSIKNDLSAFLPKKAVKPVIGITKLAQKPTVATIGRPPVAVKAPVVLTDESIIEDAEMPVE
jgi:hypothetical protein